MEVNLDSHLNEFKGTGHFVQFFEPIIVDRNLLKQTWWNLLSRLKSRHPSFFEEKAVEFAFYKINERIDGMTDDELLKDMEDIIASIEYVSLRLPIKRKEFKK